MAKNGSGEQPGPEKELHPPTDPAREAGQVGDDRKISRSRFFSTVGSSFVETLGYLAGGFLEDLAAQVEQVNDLWGGPTTWVKVLRVEEAAAGPSLRVLQGKPMYFVKRDGFLAWDALCPLDGHYLDWAPEDDSFRCMACSTMFGADGKKQSPGEEDPAVMLGKRPVKVEDGYLWVELPRD